MLRFAPIDVVIHGRECVDFRADSFAVSFGSSEGFFSEWGIRGALPRPPSHPDA
jgi:hypothetical protein